VTSTGLECGVDGLAEGLASNGSKTRNQQDGCEARLGLGCGRRESWTGNPTGLFELPVET
jgi:hypothetical protein